MRLVLLALALAAPAVPGAAQSSFVNFETPHVHPLERVGDLLLAVNTPDAVLEVFDLTGALPQRAFAVPVGYDPVSVRARAASEAWVVNHVSDSISVVDLATRNVVATLQTLDEPCDVVFAGSPERAFVTCSQANAVLVFDPANLALAPLVLSIEGEDPRALAVAPDGTKVYAALFESGNRSTILGGGAAGGVIGFPPNVVNDANGPHAGQNPPPNAGAVFDPPLNPALPAAPRVGLVVKQDAGGAWRDDTGADWTAKVSGPNAADSGRPPGWQLVDHDVAVIDTASLAVSYASGLMNLVMAVDVNPSTGELAAVGTDATNEVRFEPVLRGTFGRVEVAVTSAAGARLGVFDLNDHLDYSTSSVPAAQRAQALGDPRGIVWNAAGDRAWVSGMGSNNVVVLGSGATRETPGFTIPVGEGPTGLALHEAAGRLYVLDKFESAISVVDLGSQSEVARVPFHDASPAAIRLGRRHLYDTHANSGLGQVACATCHADARMDRLAWDLGDPSGDMKAFAGNCPDGACQDWHPLKGPMLTQTLQDIVGKEPHHWRADRAGLEEFKGAFVALQGGDAEPDAAAMQELEDFLATIHFPPNPFRNVDNSLPTALPLPGHYTTGRFAPAGAPLGVGDATRGLALYTPPSLLDGLACVSCHTLPVGIGVDLLFNGFQFVPLPPGPNGERHHASVSVDGSTQRTLKVPQLRNLYDRTGFNCTQATNTAGFGLLHDGSVDSIERFVSEPAFAVQSDQDVADLTAFLLCFSGSDLPQGSSTSLLFPPGTVSLDAHAAVGRQHTYRNGANPSAEDVQYFSDAFGLADAGAVAVVAKGRVAGEPRGYAYVGAGQFQSDRAGRTVGNLTLLAAALPGAEVTLTVVPVGCEFRLGVDRDEDGFLDGDERDAGSDPADATSTPLGPGALYCLGDGLGAACPCANPSPAGGCANSSGAGALLFGAGAAVVAQDSLQLLGSGLLPGQPALLFQGLNAVNGGAGAAFGDGLRCAGGGVVRLDVLTPDAQGAVAYPGAGDPSVSARGGAAPGDVLRYQLWYRDPQGSPCGNGFNLSNGYEVLWQ
ncbi:MAG: hypothetical protein H6828_14830 [Planctomycetes bacterium]|nr:hypothetical protein [Planctomycetota bacterium]